MTDSRSSCMSDARLLEWVQQAELPAEAAEHLATCANCATRLSELRETWALLGAVSAPAEAHDLTGRILAEAARRAAPFPWLRVAAVFVVGSVVGVTAALGVPHRSIPVAAPLGPQQVMDSLGIDALGIDPELAHSLSDVPAPAVSSHEENAI